MEVLRREVGHITQRLGGIVREQAGELTFAHFEQLLALAQGIRARHDRASVRSKHRLVARLRVAEAYRVAHAFSLYFQLVNFCEERARIRHLRADPEPTQSLRRTLHQLREAGVAPDRLQQCLDNLEVEPVLTAHPTEAKRRTTLNHILRLGRQFDEPDEILEALWQTEEVREQRVGALDEVDNTLFFFEHTIFEAAARFYATFDADLQAAYPEVKRRREFLSFASWVGGDRDGNPFVTPELSLVTVQRHRARVLGHYSCECEGLVTELSHTAPVPTPKQVPTDPFQPSETYRRQLREIRRRLDGGLYRRSAEFVRDLTKIQTGLRKQRGRTRP